MQISLIANPSAGSGRATHRLASISRALEHHGISYRVLTTKAQGHATQLAREVIDYSAGKQDHVLAVLGGDGTLSEVCQGFLDGAGQPIAGPPVALLPSGTGGDMARSLLLPENPDALIQLLKEDKPQPVDVGRIEFVDRAGTTMYRAFVNACTAGLGAAVAERVNRTPKRLGGSAAYYWATVASALKYRNLPMDIEVDGKLWHRGPLLLAAVGNGRFIGGGMNITPDAQVDDGLLDVVCVCDVSLSWMIWNLPSVRTGRHVNLPNVISTRGQKVRITQARVTDAPLAIEADGETPGNAPLVASVLPGALQMFVGRRPE